jgi:prefoldin subunit 5
LGGVHEQLGEVHEQLSGVDRQLVEVHSSLEKLDKTNQLIASVETGLGRIDTTNTSLTEVDQHLKLLQSIQASLASLDQHLASLRKTIGKIDSAIPFLGLGGDEEPEVTTAAAPAGEGAAEAAPAEPKEPKEGKESKEASKAGREPMVGTWLERYPQQELALVLLASGQYVRVMHAADAPAVQRGTWKKEGAAEYSFTPAAPVAPAAGQAGAQARPEAGPWKITVISLSGRSATVQVGERVLVLARP